MIVVRVLSGPLLLTCVATTACFSATAPTAPLTVVLAPGASASYGGLVVRFVAVTSDSRCPADALCIHQGDAVIELDARTNDSNATLTVQVNDQTHRRAVFSGYSILVDQLAPYPFGTSPIAAADYRVTLTIGRN